jgi:predicted PhzF superfamily epimerase YddE/YHI9
MSQRLHYYIVDAFTNRPFAGNPAAVVPLESWLATDLLQNIAMEMNLSETAFFIPDGNAYALRWFTPRVEVDLCGHATLASARALVAMGKLAEGGTTSFVTRSGKLNTAARGKHFGLDFPATPATPVVPPAGLIESHGAAPKYIGQNQFDFLLELESETAVRALAPDFKRLATVSCRGVIVTARSSAPEFDFVSRFFAPAVGIDEDPVTGSAHCCLGGYWSENLGKTKMVGYQASARGGVVHVELRGDRVILGGEAVVVAEGKLLVP